MVPEGGSLERGPTAATGDGEDGENRNLNFPGPGSKERKITVVGPRSKKRKAKRPTCPWCGKKAEGHHEVYALRHPNGRTYLYCCRAHAEWAGGH